MVRIHRVDILQVREVRLGELRGLSGEGSVALATLRSGIGVLAAQRTAVAEGMSVL